MRHIIGTAGHIDHGKTALIKALSGVETTHLPEEKERGMTIDLGFAYFLSPTGEPIGIIDVPGHERFLRNMVAGTWSLSVVLFVVASDVGWMEMSTQHLQLLDALGIENILLVLNKVDKIDEEGRELAILEVEESVQEILGRDLPLFFVSATTGEGIEELREGIIKSLETASPCVYGEGPHLYVDRHFSLTGIGSVVTGSLLGGSLNQRDSLHLYPGDIPVKIKGLQSYHTKTDEALEGSRVALNLRLSQKKEIERGMCLALPEASLASSNDILISLKKTFHQREENSHKNSSNEEKGSLFKNNQEVEIASGAFHQLGTLHFLESTKTYLRLRLSSPVAFFPNQLGLLLQPGESRLLASFHFISVSPPSRKECQQVVHFLKSQREPLDPKQLALLRRGYKETTEEGDFGEETISLDANWIITKKKFEEFSQEILKFTKDLLGGFTKEELPQQLKELPKGLRESFLNLLVAEKKLIQEGLLYRTSNPQKLTPTAKKILALAQESGEKGIDSRKIDFAGGAKEFKQLVRSHHLIHLEENLFYDSQTFESVVKKILDHYSKGSRFTIAQAKELTGLSRKYIIPILTQMQNRKLLDRDESDRVVL